MYEQFGAVVDPVSKAVTFRLFVPDNTIDPKQYAGQRPTHIRSIRAGGTFQSRLGQTDWDFAAGVPMPPHAHAGKGLLYESAPIAGLPDDFYEYKYRVDYDDGVSSRIITDPCTRWGGSGDENAGFVAGPVKIKSVTPHPRRKALGDLIIYELMIEDFTREARAAPGNASRAALDLVRDRLDELVALGVNAIEFMPWTAWPGESFAWGYRPSMYFSVEHQYTNAPLSPTDKLYWLKLLINECHAPGRRIHVILDCVFNHVEDSCEGRGFPYYWLWRDPSTSPFVGGFQQADFFKDLNYEHRCVQEFITDVAKYWIDVFQIDGIRFDNTLGFYRDGDLEHGLGKLIFDLKQHMAAMPPPQNQNFSFILEHSRDYGAIDVVNKVGATSCWYDPFRIVAMEDIWERRIDNRVMRALNAQKDFAPDSGPAIHIENHDHPRLACQAHGYDQALRTQPYAIALFTSPGAVMLYNGQEFGQDDFVPADGPGREISRPLHFGRLGDFVGGRLRWLYGKLAEIRRDHPALRSPNFYPDRWEDWQHKPDAQGYGVDALNQTLVFHRWGDDGSGHLERFIVVLNFSDGERGVSVPFSVNGRWEDLLGGWKIDVTSNEWFVRVGPNWGHVFWIRD